MIGVGLGLLLFFFLERISLGLIRSFSEKEKLIAMTTLKSVGGSGGATVEILIWWSN